MKNFICQNILILFSIHAVHRLGYAQDLKGPILNVGSELILYSPKPSPVHLEIECSGMKKLFWETQALIAEEYYKVTENHVPVGYSSTFTLSDAIASDTGNYTCRYHSGESATTYVYVFDNETAFVNHLLQGSVSVNIGEPIRLDCRTTHPDIKVRLLKNNEEDVTSKFQNIGHYSFTKIAKSLQETGIYNCTAKGFRNHLSWFVNIQPSPPMLYDPSIDEYANAHYVVGQDFQLNCSLPWNDNNDYISFKWTPPNENTKFTITRSDVYKESGSFAVSILKISDPKYYDSGTYTCTVHHGADNKKKVTKDINIKDSIAPYVDFEGKNTSKPLFVNEHDPVPFQWILYFKGYPDNISYSFYNQFNETLRNGARISTEFNYNEGKVSLKINDIGAEEFGKYTAVLSLEDGISDSKSVHVVVNATPKIEFESLRDVYSSEELIKVTAKVLSFDSFGSATKPSEPSVTWFFSNRCPKGIGSCETASNGIQLMATNLTKVISNRFLAEVEFESNSSGIIEARVSNKFGENKTSAHVVLSDNGQRFQFSLKYESENLVVNKSTKLKIVEGDKIEITCAALNFIYDNLTVNSANRDFFPLECSSTLSSRYCFNVSEASMELDGNYTCSAKNKITGKVETSKLEITVLELKAPHILPKSNVTHEGAEITVKDLKPFSISCYVDGLPRPTIKWFKDGVDVEKLPYDNDQKIMSRDNNQVLEFKVAQKIYEGTYKCTARNRAGVAESYIAIQVQKASLTALQWTLIILALIVITALCSTVGCLTHRVKKERKFREELRQNQLYLFEKGNIGNINPDCTVDEQAELLPYDQRYEVSKERIKLGKILGSGAFGRVMEAKVDSLEFEGKLTRVAVKMCKDSSDTTQLQALTLELKIMVHLGKHLNIVNLMGANTVNLLKGDLWILVEYCRYGNLLKFLQKYKSRFVNQIDQETGVIDPERQSLPYYDPRSPLSPGRSSYGFSGHPWGPSDVESQSRFGSMKSTQLFGRHPSVSSNSGSVTGSSARPGMYVGNPNYVTASFSRQSSDASSAKGSGPPPTSNGGCMPPYVTASQFSPKKSPALKLKRSDSNLSSEDDYHKTLATDMTVITSPTPFSPSSEAGDFSFDSNTISSEPGEIPGVNSPFTTSDLICWSWQVSNGMEYLSKRKVLHGDLAARNLLLADNNVVKISDFGLSRDIYKNDVYMKKGDGNMPIKWMSPEAIQQKIFSTQSDVWAFGITMWELFTLGNTPYPGVPLDPNFTLSLENGMRNDKPKFATNELYSLMLHCWDKNPIERPNFNQISDMLADMLSPESREDYVAMNNVYMNRNEEWMATKEVDYFNMMTSPDFGNFQQGLDQDDMAAENAYFPPGSYIPMLVLKSPSESGEEKNENHNASLGYLDMRSVRSSSPPPSASLFSPRPSQPTGNVFDFSGCPESIHTPDQMSPAETSKLLNNDPQVVSPTPVESENLLHNPPLTPTSDQLANNNNQLDDSCHSYNNIESMKPPIHKTEISESGLNFSNDNSVNYVNLSKLSEKQPVSLISNETSNYINTGLV